MSCRPGRGSWLGGEDRRSGRRSRGQTTPVEDAISTLAGTVSLDGDDADEDPREFDLYQGDPMFGWGRISKEHGDMWDSPKAFLDDLNHLADGGKTYETIDGTLTAIVAELEGSLVVVSAFAGVISDVDVWNPNKNWLPGPVMMQELLGAYAELMAAAEGPDWLEGYPPVFPSVAPEPVEREGGKEHCEEAETFTIKTVNGKAGAEARPDGQVPATGCLERAVRMMDALFDPVARNAVETSLANAAVDRVRSRALNNSESTEVDWYWGLEPEPDQDCEEPGIRERRRCDALAGTGLASTSDSSKRWFTRWDTSGNRDALSAEGLLLGSPSLAGGSSWAELLCGAEKGFEVVQGTYAARIPSALDLDGEVVYLEWAETTEDFNYGGGC